MKSDARKYQDELSTAEAKKFIDDLAAFHVPVLLAAESLYLSLLNSQEQVFALLLPRFMLLIVIILLVFIDLAATDLSQRCGIVFVRIVVIVGHGRDLFRTQQALAVFVGNAHGCVLLWVMRDSESGDALIENADVLAHHNLLALQALPLDLGQGEEYGVVENEGGQLGVLVLEV